MFSDWLGQQMRAASLTEAALARSVGVSQQAVSRWHTGLARPSGVRIGKLASALGTSVEEIIRQLERDGEAGKLRPEPKKDRDLERQVLELTGRVERLEQLLRAQKVRSR